MDKHPCVVDHFNRLIRFIRMVYREDAHLIFENLLGLKEKDIKKLNITKDQYRKVWEFSRSDYRKINIQREIVGDDDGDSSPVYENYSDIRGI